MDSPKNTLLTLQYSIGSVLFALLIFPYLVAAEAQGLVFVSAAKDRSILAYRQSNLDGSLSLLTSNPIDAEPGYLVANERGTRLFAALRSSGEITTFRIDNQTGKLTLTSRIQAGADPAYLALDHTESFLLSAFYRAGKVGIHALNPAGQISLQGSEWTPTNLTAHAIQTDPSNQWALVPHTRPNAIYIFRFNPETGDLLSGAPPLLHTGSFTGPRHLQFHPNLDRVYFDNEQGSSVSAFAFRPEVGQLSHLQTLSTRASGAKGKNTCADLELSPDGRFLYASNRGDNSIAAFQVDESNGKLKPIGQFPTEAIPRSFAISPSGKWLIAAGQASNHLQVYELKAENGQLIPRHRLATGMRPWAVLALSQLAH